MDKRNAKRRKAIQKMHRLTQSVPFVFAFGVFVSFLSIHHQIATVYHYFHRGDYRPSVMTLSGCRLEEYHRGRRSRVTGSIDGEECVGDGYLLEVKADTTEQLLKEVPSGKLAVLFSPRLREYARIHPDSFRIVGLDMSVISASFAKRGPTYIAWLLGLSNSVLVGAFSWFLFVDNRYRRFWLQIASEDALSLASSPISDARLATLIDVTKLRRLILRNCPVTDNRLRGVARLTEVESVDLSGTQVTDEGLIHLQGLTRLKYVDLRRTSVTPAGQKALQDALPRCKIRR